MPCAPFVTKALGSLSSVILVGSDVAAVSMASDEWRLVVMRKSFNLVSHD